MAVSKSQFIVLAEDEQQQSFVYRWLREQGVEARKIRKIPVPAGKGAGEQYVREKYAEQVKAHRSRKNHLSLRLVVLIDADLQTVELRRGQLEDQLKTAQLQPMDPGEGICLLVPRRNIETWIHHINGGAADETTDYKPKTPEECGSAAVKLVQANGKPVHANELPSLTRGRTELAKL
jgi:hypothetical protein